MTTPENTLAQATAEAEALERLMGDLEARGQVVGEQLARTFASAVINGKSLEETLKAVALKLSNIALNQGMKPLEALLGQAVTGLAGGRVQAFAAGGVVSAPTYFAHAGGAGLMGEAGAEAILPLKRGPDGALGVAAGGGGGTTIHFHITTPDPQSFRRSEPQLAAMLARTVRRGQGRL
jgi:phage-related minor tail protein